MAAFQSGALDEFTLKQADEVAAQAATDKRDAVRSFYLEMRHGGESHNMASMLALRSAPRGYVH